MKRRQKRSAIRCRKGELRQVRTRWGKTWYKTTTMSGHPFYGRGTYHLPRDGKPGAWHVHHGRLEECVSGFHVTQHPGAWLHGSWLDGRIFIVKATGFAQCLETNPSKRVCRAIRFIREVRANTREWYRLVCRWRG